LVDQVNVHGYQYAQGKRAELFKIVGGKRLWNSEYGDERHDGLGLARDLNLDFQYLRPTAWAYWQPLDGGGNGGWGLLPANMRNRTIGKANPKYFVLAHYSRHIRPGMTILVTGENEMVAAYEPKARKLVIVAQNLTDKAGKTIEVLVNSSPTKEGARTVKLKPISGTEWMNLDYEAWVKKNRERVEKLSDGRLAYLHIRGMDSSALRRFEREFYTDTLDKDGLVLDIRSNGGGNDALPHHTLFRGTRTRRSR
jgi:hypothetical protein